MNFLNILDGIGLITFAISGLLAASEKKMDLFGGFIIAFVTALGGGTLRDVLINTEVSWVYDETPIIWVSIGVVLGYLFKKNIHRLRKTLFLFDTIGIALFTIVGVQKAIALDVPIPTALIVGVITATFGGVIRDILCNEIPLIFQKEIYAIPCIIGAGVYLTLDSFESINENINLIISGATIILIRTIAVIRKLELPSL